MTITGKGVLNMGKDKLTVKEAYEMFGLKYTLRDRISTPFCRIRRIFRDGWCDFRDRCQRFRRGYAYSDVWDMDHWFVATVKPMLEYMLKTHNSYPGEITDAEWSAILQEMIQCLKLMDEDAAQEYLCIVDEEWSIAKHERTSATMKENKKRFFELFDKWFYNLWD